MASRELTGDLFASKELTEGSFAVKEITGVSFDDEDARCEKSKGPNDTAPLVKPCLKSNAVKKF